jgi:hypothetical protein
MLKKVVLSLKYFFMKKFILSSIIIASLLFNSFTFSYTLTTGENDAIDKAVNILQTKIIKNDEKVKDTLVATLNKISAKYTNDEKKYEILKVLTEKIDSLNFKPQDTE